MRATTGGAAIAAWLTAHPQTDDTTINQWLYNGDGNDVAALTSSPRLKPGDSCRV